MMQSRLDQIVSPERIQPLAKVLTHVESSRNLERTEVTVL